MTYPFAGVIKTEKIKDEDGNDKVVWQYADDEPRMNDFHPDWDTVKSFDDRYNEDTELLRQCLEALSRNDYLGWQLNIPIIKALKERLK